MKFDAEAGRVNSARTHKNGSIGLLIVVEIGDGKRPVEGRGEIRLRHGARETILRPEVGRSQHQQDGKSKPDAN